MFTRILDADLRFHPPVETGHHPSEVTLGDLHGNAMKLIYALLAENVIYFEKDSEANYQELYEIYSDDIWDKQQHALTDENYSEIDNLIKRFKEILLKAKARPGFSLLRLIGDELCDRGKNDELTLSVFDIIFPKIEKATQGAEVEILLSNHGAEFINLLNPFNGQAPQYQMELDTKETPKFGRSYLNFRKLCNHKSGSALSSELTKSYYHHLNHIKLMSYKKDTSTDPHTFYLYTHAHVGLETVIGLAKVFGVEYKDSTMDELGDTIDAINKRYKNSSPEECAKASLEFRKDPMIHRLIWRVEEEESEEEKREFYLPALPEKRRDFGVVNVHGHLGPVGGRMFRSEHKNAVNTDSSKLAKGDKAITGHLLSVFSNPSIRAEEKYVQTTSDMKTESNISLIFPIITAAHAVAPDRLRKFIADLEERKTQAHCFWLSKDSKELKVAKKFLAFYEQKMRITKPKIENIVSGFESSEIKLLTNLDTLLGEIVGKMFLYNIDELESFVIPQKSHKKNAVVPVDEPEEDKSERKYESKTTKPGKM